MSVKASRFLTVVPRANYLRYRLAISKKSRISSTRSTILCKKGTILLKWHKALRLNSRKAIAIWNKHSAESKSLRRSKRIPHNSRKK